jgi:UDP-N-acetylmuramate dehydrogenase
MPAEWVRGLQGVARGEFKASEPMSRHCSFRIGGPADLLFTPAGPQDLGFALEYLKRQKVPRMVIGNGTNLLIGDGGFRGALIRLGRGFDNLRTAGAEDGGVVVEAGAAVTLGRLRLYVSKKGFVGTEFMYGIPGTVGGAVMCNAGTRLGEMKDIVKEIEIIDPSGRIKWVAAKNAGFSYRECRLPEGSVIMRVRMGLASGGGESSEADLDELRAHRRAKQPWGLASAGSVFRNPPDDYAGRLVDAAGLKGLRLGGAEVSHVHANFIVNRGRATAAEVRRLMEVIQAEVERIHGVRLVPEIRMAGEF